MRRAPSPWASACRMARAAAAGSEVASAGRSACDTTAAPAAAADVPLSLAGASRARSLTLAGATDALRLYTLVPDGYEGAGEALSIGSVPSDLDGPVELPLHAEALMGGSASGAAGTLAWDAADLPAGWSATLVDRRSGERYDLTEAGAFELEISENDAMAVSDAPTPTASKAAASRTAGKASGTASRRSQAEPSLLSTPFALRARATDARFMVTLVPDAQSVTSTDFELSIGEAYPNPSRGNARIAVPLPAESEVTLEVIDALGRRVVQSSTTYAEGPQEVTVPMAGLAAGNYVVRLQTNGEAVTRRLTVVR